MIQSVDLEQTAIVNQNFIQQLKKDIQKYDILYIYAPFGWNQEQILAEFYRTCGEKNMFWLEETDTLNLEEQIAKLPSAGKKTYLIPQLERIMEQGQETLILKLLSEKKKGDVFLFASSMTIPERLLPYTLFNKFISYGIEAVRPSNEDVAAYMKSREVLLSQDELFCIEKDTDNIPLLIQMLSNVMAGTDKGYRRRVKEQCFEDTFAYIDVVFFRTFTEEEQNALLKLSYFESFDKKLIAYMLKCSTKEAEKFIERMLNKTSVFQKRIRNGNFRSLSNSSWIEQFRNILTLKNVCLTMKEPCIIWAIRESGCLHCDLHIYCRIKIRWHIL